MELAKPTEEQIKKLWERCGFRYIFGEKVRSGKFTEQNYYWIAPTGRRYFKIPLIDLNNLFAYVMPFLQDKGYQIDIVCFEHKGFAVSPFYVLDDQTRKLVEIKGDDLALALFWAIYEVLDGDNTPAKH